MATIQIRDLPDETYEVFRHRAAEAGMSLQKYMREQLIKRAASPAPEDIWTAADQILASEDTPGLDVKQALADLRELRDE